MNQDTFKSQDADRPLNEADMSADPITQFESWYAPVLQSDLWEPTAMTLATATTEGVPSARVVLLKSFDMEGFVFYTNFDSRKGAELASNPHAALMMWWPPMTRQVRITGQVARISDLESDAYFASRGKGKQISASISQQSQVVTREHLESEFARLEAKYRESDVPRPPFWGGYRLSPLVMEFWQGRSNRLHDRLRYTRTADGWTLERLAP